MGTVTVNARKTSAINIRAIRKGINDYGIKYTKSKEDKVFADRYGVRYVGRLGQPGASVGVLTKASNGTTTFDNIYEEDVVLLSRMRREYLPAACGEIALANQIANRMEEEMKQEHQAANQFWQDMSQHENQFNNQFNNTHQGTLGDYYDPTVEPLFKDVFEERPSYPPSPKDYKFKVIEDGEVAWLREYQDRIKTYTTYWNSFCGPWIAGFITSTSYNKNVEAYIFDKEGYTVQGGLFRGAMTAPCLNNALKDYSGGKISMGLWSSSRWDAYWHIREGKSAVRLLVNWQGSGTQSHWTQMYGSFRVKRFLTTNYYFLQADNGTLIDRSYRISRDVTDNDNYTILGWFDAIFLVNDRNIISQ